MLDLRIMMSMKMYKNIVWRFLGCNRIFLDLYHHGYQELLAGRLVRVDLEWFRH